LEKKEYFNANAAFIASTVTETWLPAITEPMLLVLQFVPFLSTSTA
jgi:hypothetical protein